MIVYQTQDSKFQCKIPNSVIRGIPNKLYEIPARVGPLGIDPTKLAVDKSPTTGHHLFSTYPLSAFHDRNLSDEVSQPEYVQVQPP